jgi:PiT family inorganic phosphate transporter
MTNPAVLYVLAIVVVAYIFDFINGFHDSANSIATVVGTRVLSPFAAVAWAAFFNFVALWAVGTAVAKTIGKGMIDVNVVTPDVILGGLIGAIIWNLITWWFGLPSSSSHALIGGYAGAAIVAGGFGAIIPAGWTKTIVFIFLSPIIGMMLGFWLMVATFWIFRRSGPRKVDRLFRGLQLASSALFSLSHGANDAQKTMGIVASLLVASQALFVNAEGWLRHLYLPNADHIPFWIAFAAHFAIGMGTLLGGWRIVHTMGTRRFLCGDRWRDQHPDGDNVRNSGQYDAHDHRLDRRCGRYSTPFRGAVGSCRSNCVGVDPDDSGCRGDGSIVLSNYRRDTMTRGRHQSFN